MFIILSSGKEYTNSNSHVLFRFSLSSGFLNSHHLLGAPCVQSHGRQKSLRNPQSGPRSWCGYYPHFTDEVTEAWRGYITCPKSELVRKGIKVQIQLPLRLGQKPSSPTALSPASSPASPSPSISSLLRTAAGSGAGAVAEGLELTPPPERARWGQTAPSRPGPHP